jgi:hypothetical protein
MRVVHKLKMLFILALKIYWDYPMEENNTNYNILNNNTKETEL